MKVVLFCGGLGTRLREFSETIPKPLVDIGNRPIIWHLMKYYACQGHKDFILCLGYRGDLIKEFFLEYNECKSNNFSMQNGGREINLFNRDISEWKIIFIDTGLNAPIGSRLKSIEPYIEEDEIFLANYSDGLSNIVLQSHIDHLIAKNAVASFVSVKPWQSLHNVSVDSSGIVTHINRISESNLWINGGFFVMNRKIFKYLKTSDELVEDTFPLLIKEKRLVTLKHEGFWAAIDTYKDKKRFDSWVERGHRPWETLHTSLTPMIGKTEEMQDVIVEPR